MSDLLGTNRSSPRLRRGFSLVEILVTVAIVGMIALIVAAGMSRTLKRGQLEGAAQNVKALVQRAGNEMKIRGRATFVQLARVPAAGPTPAFWRVSLYADSNDSGALEVGTDLLVQSIDLPSTISLSTTSATAIASTNWSTDTADASPRYLECDTLSRTLKPGTPSAQIQSIATVDVTHVDMVPAGASATLRPQFRYQVRIAPVWSVSIERDIYQIAASTWSKS